MWWQTAMLQWRLKQVASSNALRRISTLVGSPPDCDLAGQRFDKDLAGKSVGPARR